MSLFLFVVFDLCWFVTVRCLFATIVIVLFILCLWVYWLLDLVVYLTDQCGLWLLLLVGCGSCVNVVLFWMLL